MAKVASKGENYVIYDNGIIKVRNVRCSFPHLAAKWANNEGEKPKYSCAAMMLKETHEAAYKALSKHCKTIAEEKKVKVAPANYFLRDGDESNREEEEGYWTFNSSEEKPISVVGKDNVPLDKDEIDEEIFPGCIIDIMIQPWVQDNKFGKKVNSSLRSVRFRKDDGVRFGMGPVDCTDLWDEEEEEDDDDDF